MGAQGQEFHTGSEEDHEILVEGLSDTLAGWWEAATGEETYAHQWVSAAEAALRVGPSKD